MKYLLILSFLLSCSPKYQRTPSSVEQGKLSLIIAEVAETFVEGLSTRACTVASKDLYDKLFNLTYVDSRFQNIQNKKAMLQRTFYSRLVMRDYLYKVESSIDDLECIKGMRDLTRSLRYLEDYLVGSIYSGPKELDALTGDSTVLLVNPEYNFKSHADLQSGDIIVSRGNAFTSAAIARIGNEDSQFSHASFVYRDDAGKLHTTEAHIEIGSVALPFKAHLEEKNSRAVVFRYYDGKLAHRAAKHMYNKVKSFSEHNEENIFYDFAMDYHSNSELFCSEVVYDGFNYASMGRVDVPRYKTTFDPKIHHFLTQIGIKVKKEEVHKFSTFSPGDLDFDVRFKLVAEWRDPSKIVKVRVRDAVLTKMFEWMSEKKYLFKPGVKVKAKAYMAYLARRTPWIKDSFIEKFPLNMKPKQMRLFLNLDIIAGVLEEEILSRKDYQNLSFKQMYSILEYFRAKDYKVSLKSRSKSKFHKFFRP